MKYICKKFINHHSSSKEMFAISLSSCSRYNANFKLDQSQSSLFMTVHHFFEISEDEHRCILSAHARESFRAIANGGLVRRL